MMKLLPASLQQAKRAQTACCNIINRTTQLSQIGRQARHIHRNVSKARAEHILPATAGDGYRPVRRVLRGQVDPSHSAYYVDVLVDDIQLKPRISLGRKENDWWFQCSTRLLDLVRLTDHAAQGFFYWGSLRFGCVMAMRDGLQPKEEADVRLVCAHSQPGEHLPIYYTMHEQADALYLLGRTELERNPKFHRAAWYMLNLATELGQFDAALLLHRLERANSTLTAGTKARSMIAQMALDQRDWRAVMAYVEMEVLDKAEDKRSMYNIAQAVLLLSNSYLHKVQPLKRMTAGPDLQPLSHPDALEEYVPICRYLWETIKIGGDEVRSYLESKGSLNEHYWQQYAAALHEDAIQHRNPKAMYEVTKLSTDFGYEESQSGSRQRRRMLEGASLSVPEASYTLGKETCKETSLLPTRKALERANQQEPQPTYPPSTSRQEESVQYIIDTAKMYHNKNATTEAYLYLLALGLYHDNGMLKEGKAVAESAILSMRGSTELENLTWIKLFEGLIKHWDSYHVNGLYTDVRPEKIIQKLDKIILSQGDEP